MGKTAPEKKILAAQSFGQMIGIEVDIRGCAKIDGLHRDVYEMMENLSEVIREYGDTEKDSADFTIEMFYLKGIKDKSVFGKSVQSALCTYFY